MKFLFSYKEPILGTELRFVEAGLSELTISKYQRPLSNALISSLNESFSGLGCITPIICVDKDGILVVVDGQHRIEVLKKKKVDKVLCIVLPSEYEMHILDYNIEKPSDLKTRCMQVLFFYKDQFHSGVKEYQLAPYIKQSYYITFGYAFSRVNFPASIFESFAKKVDSFLDKDIKAATNIRIMRASYVIELWNKIYPSLEGIDDFSEKKKYFNSIVKSVYPGRKIEDSFEEAFRKVIENI